MDGIIISINKEGLAELIHSAVKSALIEFENSQTKLEKDEDIMTGEDVAAWLNMKMSTLYYKTHSAEIPFMKKGGRIYFSRKVLLEWLSDGKRLTTYQNIEIADERLLKARKRKMNFK